MAPGTMIPGMVIPGMTRAGGTSVVECGGLGPPVLEGEVRHKKQWSTLVEEDPASEECLEKHLEALEKARDKCAKKLAEVRQQKAEQEALEKAKEEAEETSTWESAKGKKKQRSKSNKASPTIESSSGSASSSNAPLRKEARKRSKSRNESQLRGTPAPIPQESLQALEKAPNKDADEGTSSKALEKAPSKDAEEATSSKKIGKMGYRAVLSTRPGSMSLKSKAESEGLGLEKPKVLVDWHGTLEKANGWAPKYNLWALDQLLEKAEVYLLSWVGSEWRKDKAMKEMMALEKADEIQYIGTTFHKLKKNGKVDHAVYWGCCAVIDDDWEVCEEARQSNLMTFEVRSKKPSHTLEKDQFRDFREAVLALLDRL